MYFNQFAVDDTLFNTGLARLAGTSNGAVTVTGVFGNQLSGSCNVAISAASGTLSQRTLLSASALGTATTVAGLQQVIGYRPYTFNGKGLNYLPLNALNEANVATTATCVVTATGTLKLVMTLAATGTGTVLTSATMSGTQPLAGTATAVATVQAALQDQIRLASSITGAVTISAALRDSLNLQGTATGFVTVAANVKRDVQPGAMGAGYAPVVTLSSFSTTAPVASVNANQVSVATSTTTIYANATS